jgi:hypothetical protein
MPCCTLTWRLPFPAKESFQMFLNMTKQGGPDGRYSVVGIDVDDGLPYLLKAEHKTPSGQYTDTLNLWFNDAPSNTGTIARAFSISQTVRAYEDSGQNYSNLESLYVGVFGAPSQSETTEYGCPNPGQ